MPPRQRLTNPKRRSQQQIGALIYSTRKSPQHNAHFQHAICQTVTG
jgi:hypothetical protein